MSRRKNEEDVGYGDSLDWEYKTRRLADATVRFDDCGNRTVAVEIVNAAKRLFFHSPPNSVESAIANVRVLLQAVTKPAVGSTSVQGWNDALISSLRQRATGTSSRHTRYKLCSLILREIARERGEAVVLRNPFPMGEKTLPLADPESVRKTLLCARRDVARFWSRFTADDSHEDWAIIERARDLARRNGGFLPHFEDTAPLRHEFVRWIQWLNYHRPEPIGRRTLEPYCYATPRALLAIIILIVHRLAGNVDSVVSLRRDCLREIPDPVYGSRFILTMAKPRARRDLQYRLLDSGRLSVPSLIRMALALTEPLVPLADQSHRHLLFLTSTHRGQSLPFLLVSKHFKAYLEAANISPPFTLQSVRPTQIVKTYTDTGDPFRAKHEAKHANLSQTMGYLRRHEVAQFDESIIADTQDDMFHREIRAADSASPEHHADAVLPSHTCLDPAHPEHADVENGLCMNLLWPLNDRHFVMPLEPKPVAFLLRDYAALKEAQRTVSSDRFNALYRTKMLLIEQQYLPQITESLADTARALVPSLPAALTLS